MRSFSVARARAAAVVVVAATGLLGAAVPGAGAAAAPRLSISVSGRHFVNQAGHIVRLLGVNRESSEYACADGYAYNDGHYIDADARAIASWGATAVRVPLNEDCWLGINGQPNSSQGASPRLTVAGYRHTIAAYVADLNRHGLYAVLDLHWTAPGRQVALEQQPMPDADHSPAFWTSVASAFKGNHAVVFDLFNEPYDPTDPRSGDDRNASDKVSWNCWQTGTRNGTRGGAACTTAAYDDNGNRTSTYRIAGLQSLLNAVRATGATQPVLAGGLNYANDLTGWLGHPLRDPRHQVAAAFHNYQGQVCDTTSCWTRAIAPVAAHVPVVTGEFDENNYLQARCANHTPTSYDATYMKWADAAGIGYLAWGWIALSKAELDQGGCSAYVLINDYSRYTPANPNGVVLRAHLLALAHR